MSIEIIRPDEIDSGLEAAWRGFQDAGDDLKSPFFTPDFCRIVGRVRDDTRIAVCHEAGAVTGIFPYHRQRFGRLAPLAGQISDYHGVLCAPGTRPDMQKLLRAAGAQAFDFNHAPASQGALADHAFRRTTSPLIDLRGGFDAWFADKTTGTRSFRELGRRTRKLGRDHGPVRFIANDTSDETWSRFMDWKRAALAGLGVGFILDRPWAGAVAEAVRHSESPHFAGMTSSLWAGDELVSVHFGMRSATTLHWWFPAYADSWRKFSPGLILIVEALKQFEALGLTELDFGRGDQRYKQDFMTGARALAEGSVERPLSPLGLPRRMRKGLQGAIGRLPSPTLPEFTRRAGDRLLAAGRIF